MKKWKLRYTKPGRVPVFIKVLRSNLTWYLLRQDLIAVYGTDFLDLSLVED